MKLWPRQWVRDTRPPLWARSPPPPGLRQGCDRHPDHPWLMACPLLTLSWDTIIPGTAGTTLPSQGRQGPPSPPRDSPGIRRRGRCWDGAERHLSQETQSFPVDSDARVKSRCSSRPFRRSPTVSELMWTNWCLCLFGCVDLARVGGGCSAPAGVPVRERCSSGARRCSVGVADDRR